MKKSMSELTPDQEKATIYPQQINVNDVYSQNDLALQNHAKLIRDHAVDNQPNVNLFSLLQSGEIIVVLDNDGTIFESVHADAWRIHQVLVAIDANNTATSETIYDMMIRIGYGKKTWLDGLVKELKEMYPHLSQEQLETLQKNLKPQQTDDLIVEMGQHMVPLCGAKHFLQTMKLKESTVAICSDNYSPAVSEAINTQFKGFYCCLPDNQLAHPHASKQASERGDHEINLNDTMGRDLKGKYKPEPTKLLIQVFKGLLRYGAVNQNELDNFLMNADFREEIKLRPNYRSAVYIGDDVKDYLVAKNANLDYFIAVTTTGKCNKDEFRETIASHPSKTEVLLVDDLSMLNNLLQSSQLKSRVKLFDGVQTTNTPEAAATTEWGASY